MNQSEKYNKIKLIYYLSVLFLIYLCNSFVAISTKGFYVVFLTLLVCLMLFIFRFSNIKITFNLLCTFVILMFFTIASLVINGDDGYQYIIFWAALCSAFLFCVSVPFLIFKTVFVDVMYFLACFSLLTYLVSLLSPNLLSFLPLITNSEGLTARNCFFSVVPINEMISIRNFGLFWEPGAYQTYLNIALFFEMFANNKPRIRTILLLLIAIITTLSTTGYTIGGALCITYILYHASFFSKREKTNNRIMWSAIFAIVLGITMFLFIPSESQFVLWGKLRILFDDTGTYYSGYESTNIRLQAFVQPFLAFFENPIFGLGYERFYLLPLISGYGMNVVTPINWLALFGIVFGLISNLCYMHVFNNSNIKWYYNCLLKLFMLLAISSEDYHRNTLILCFVLYGAYMLPKIQTKLES